MLDNLDLVYQLEVAKNVAHQQMLLADNIGFGYKTMAKLLKKDWKAVGITKQTITNLIGCMQPVVTILKKNFGNRSRAFLDIKKYWGQALYNWFYNIDKALGSNKFFCCLGTIIKQYKYTWMLVALQAFNNIIAYKLPTSCCEVLSDSYHHQIINDF